jgi:membrane-associated protease RseP (regulator of RpoE activity)
VQDLIPAFTAWRTVQAGSREVVDAIVAPEHRGPSRELAHALKAWRGAWYWPGRDRSHLILIRETGPRRRERWMLHLVLFLVTISTMLGAGAALAGSWTPPPSFGLLGLLQSAGQFFVDTATGGWRQLIPGWSFAIPLLAILLIHELGHYFAARRYEIDTSPPFFLPFPPTLSPIGSLGAFIRLHSPVLDRRQLLDVGAAGPLAGFVAALAVMVWGYSTSAAVPAGIGTAHTFVSFAGTTLALGDSLLTDAFRDFFFPGAGAVHLSLPAFAGWVGMFVTGLNLIPLSQLDGGHVLYGLLGRRQAVIGFLAILGLVYLGQYHWTWYAWVVLALLVGGGRWSHPAVVAPGRSIPRGRHVVGWLCVLIFVLTFVAVPFSL